MSRSQKAFPILMIDDDGDDCMMVKEAFAEAHVANEIRCLEDGVQAMNYLSGCGPYGKESSAPCPGLILLDLNMPRMDGRETLKQIKSHPDLRSIPVIILTTSKEKKDIVQSYEAGASSFITKPNTFEGLVQALKALKKYYFEVAQLPGQAFDS
jgi:CheY-like chemotaxis protein